MTSRNSNGINKKDTRSELIINLTQTLAKKYPKIKQIKGTPAK